jgi:hypothetical protein
VTAPDERLIVLAAGDTVYVFDDVEKARMQYLVCVAANLDVQQWRIAAQRWPEVRAGLEDLRDGTRIVDARSAPDPDPGSGL